MIIRVFPRRTPWTPTDPLAFIGFPPLFRPPDIDVEVLISVVFTWDKKLGEELLVAWGALYRNVKLGGPAFGSPSEEFTPGLFIKKGVTITSRGCDKSCPWCFVREREGRIRELRNIAPGYIVQDNNLLQCSKGHIERVFAMLRSQNKRISFNGGLDAVYFEPWHNELLKTIKINELWFACDTPQSIKQIEKISPLLDWLPQRKKRIYVLLGFNGETIEEAERRLQKLFKLGFMPFAQLFRSTEKMVYPPEWRKLVKTWSRPALIKETMRAVA